MKENLRFTTKSRKFLLPVVILLLGSILYGCYVIRVIRQPILGDPDSSFEVDIVLDPNPGDDYTGGSLKGYGLFGVQLPEGWTVEDKIEYHFVSEDPAYNADGILSFNAAQGEALKAKHDAPVGYYWWGGKTDVELNMFKFDSLYFTIKVLTDHKLGNFKLKYAFGDTENADRTPSRSGSLSNDYPIKIGLITDAEEPVSKELNVYPNPSTGVFSVDYQKEIRGTAEMKVYNSNGQIVSETAIEKGTNHVDLSRSPKGIYVVAIENAGKVRTRKVLLQ